jgi:hypothetical protein
MRTRNVTSETFPVNQRVSHVTIFGRTRHLDATRPVFREGFTSQLFSKIGADFAFFDFIGNASYRHSHHESCCVKVRVFSSRKRGAADGHDPTVIEAG